jgi:RNA polymerase sigma-70 factor (ECF subfamily)
MSDICRNIEVEIPSLRRYARALAYDHSAADDLVQNYLARAIDKIHLWQQGTNLRAWLFTILHNQHVNQIRLQVRMGTTLDIEDADPFLSRPGDQEKSVELRDLEKALGQLPEAQRAAILLIGLEGMSYAEASTVLGVPVGTVRSRVSRGRDALRDLMRVDVDRRDVAEIGAVHEARYRPGRMIRAAPTGADTRACLAAAGTSTLNR